VPLPTRGYIDIHPSHPSALILLDVWFRCTLLVKPINMDEVLLEGSSTNYKNEGASIGHLVSKDK
jgi:hypothetical protein